MLKKNKGFTLISLLISILLGSIVISIVSGLYVNVVSINAKQIKYTRLRNEIDTIISLLESDIRRAGFGGVDFMLEMSDDHKILLGVSKDNSCIVFAYDEDQNSKLNEQDKMAFRFEPKLHSIQYKSNIPLTTSSCKTTRWENITDPSFIKITKLNFIDNIIRTDFKSSAIHTVTVLMQGELLSDKSYSHSIKTNIQIRNLE